jgi:beta-glucosidase
MSDLAFPDRFLWGAATSAYQVEGSPLADGAGPSTWHRFCRTPGAVADGETGDAAADHYRRWKDDLALMRELGLRAYRFSIAWGRVLPEGSGRVNQPGLDFYRRLVDGLLEAGIAPIATLYHWDLPAALDERGGWVNPDVADWFAGYAAAAASALDGVRLWATLNEPWVVADAGYMHGVHAPGHRSRFEAALVSGNLLRAHAAGVDALRAAGRNGVGLVVNLEPKHPASDRPEDHDATRRSDAYWNRQYLDPALRGEVPDELAEVYGEAWSDRAAGRFEGVRRPLDWLGVNYYTRAVVRHDASAFPERVARVRQPKATYTSLDWEVYPQGLTEILARVSDRYGPLPLLVTENGAAFYDPPTADGGRVCDPLRTAYLRRHLKAAREALRRGVDLRGYCVWSLLDNFEWSLGTTRRFGIVHVDYATQERTVKDSGRFYAEVIRTGGACLDDEA